MLAAATQLNISGESYSTNTRQKKKEKRRKSTMVTSRRMRIVRRYRENFSLFVLEHPKSTNRIQA